jgi:3-isopropylmalate/(R)-2-methylmalate dehydratase large subunit
MPMTMAEKLLAKAVGRPSVKPGEVIAPDPELVILHDGYVETSHRQLSQLGYRRVTNPERVVIITDHNVINTSPRAIEQSRANRRIAAEWNVGHFFDVGRGGHGHIYPMEAGMVRPGMFLIAYDMHCTNFGAIGTFAMRAGPDIPVVLATGTLWTMVPQTLRVDLVGAFKQCVYARDLGFKLSSDLTSGRLGVEYDDRVVEFGGEAVERMSISERVALCNTLTEIGVNNILFPPLSFSGSKVDQGGLSDPDAQFENRITIDLSELGPQVALPGSPDRAVNVGLAAGRSVDQAYIGACGSAMYEDFERAAKIIRGKKVAPNVRFFVVPGTISIAQKMMETGLTKDFMDAGAIFLPAGCGPCAGGVGAPLGPGEVSISTAATNGPGRMGARDAECYLASPVTVTASAIAGKIVDPRHALSTAQA